MKNEIYHLKLKIKNDIQTVNVEYRFDERDDVSRAKIYLPDETLEISADCTENVFRRLIIVLEGKYEVHSCYTCRYGNFCPTGDRDNEIFCINDFEPKRISDLYFVTEDSVERKKRSRTLFDICKEYQPCSSAYFTYK